MTDDQIWRTAKVWWTRDPRAYSSDPHKGWYGLSDVERMNYYKNAKAVLIALSKANPKAKKQGLTQ